MNWWPLRLAIGFASALCMTACGPSPNDPAVKSGSLNNGGFLFQCEDGVDCHFWSAGDAEKFPRDGVALGSTFRIRYRRNEDLNVTIFDVREDSAGITVRGNPPFFTGAPDNRIAAISREGWGTIVAQTAAGGTADFVSLRVVKPDAVVVLDADDSLVRAPAKLTSVTLGAGAVKNLRIAAEAASRPLAGSLPARWTVTPDNVARIESVSDGVAKLVAVEAGKATLAVDAGGFNPQLEVTVE
ncbi:MAG: hypothetical protein KIT84_11650 [Labilithrix sp.]|nr:hypothetical protein [Labilithrix sp.]MCW5811664.1 hypothetical protein [Labilithrix sp.]